MNLKYLIPPLFILIASFYIGYIVITRSRVVPEIRYGVDRCDNCGMVISEKRFSALAYYKTENRWVKFDDLGGLFLYIVKHGGLENFQDIYVFDYNTGERINGESAYYMKADPERVWTPMSSGIVAFKDETAAKKFAEKIDGTLYDFHELYIWVYNNPDKVFQMSNMNM